MDRLTSSPTALIADDEPLLRDVLRGHLIRAWPDLRIVAEARNGLEAVEMHDALRPTVCFLDLHMPGMSGIEVAQRIGRRAHVVFITAFDQYALQAFEHGVFDYLVKPVQAERLAESVLRLRDRLRMEQPARASDELLAQLSATLQRPAAAPLRFLRATVGQSLRLIPVAEIDFLKSDDKYTLVAWRGECDRPGEAFIRTPLKTLLPQLDPAVFVQVHRSFVVNLESVRQVMRAENETREIFFRHRPDVVPVSRTWAHLFRPE